MRDSWRHFIAEFVGIFALVFVGGASIMATSAHTESPLLAVAVAHGLILSIMVTATMRISGHLNPAVTLGFLVTKRIAPMLALWYWIVQFGGAALAALLLKWVLPTAIENQAHLGAPSLGGGITSGAAVVVEAVLTFFLVIVVFATAVDPRGAFKQISGLAIGFTIALGILMSGVLTGGMMNPARAFGPQLLADNWKHFWIWYVGPFAGAVIAASLYELLYLRPARPEPVGPPETGVEEPGAGEAAIS
jgi:MIP family channel proteins